MQWYEAVIRWEHPSLWEEKECEMIVTCSTEEAAIMYLDDTLNSLQNHGRIVTHVEVRQALTTEERAREAERLQKQTEQAHMRGKSFVDQNGLRVHDGGVYGIDEQGDLYELEPLMPFRPSEY